MTNIIQTLETALETKKNPSEQEKQLFRKAQDFTEYIRWIPGLRMVAVSNSLAMYATHKDSDIDLFIVTAPRRLWIVRTLVLVIATFLGVRIKPGNEAGRFCFPFFMTETSLSFKNIAIKNDIYLAYWILSLKPLYNKYYTYGRFMEVNRALCADILDFHPSEDAYAALLKENRIFLQITRRQEYTRKIGALLSPLLNITDSILGFFSKKHIMKKIPSEDTEGIVINDDIIKLHYTDRRREIRDSIIETSA